jgi:CheY-like chemotaxis protein
MSDHRPRLHFTGGADSSASIDLVAVGDAMALVTDGQPCWNDERFEVLDSSLRDQCLEWCLHPDHNRRRTHIQVDGNHWEVIRAPASNGSWLAILFEVTDDRKHQLRRQAITAAGSELLHLDRSMVAELNVAERLRLLEAKIIQHVRSELNFDNFEIRLLDSRTRQLELVIAENINPLKIGEVIYADPIGNGISGWVAATGSAYRCDNVQEDPLYREGLDDAASSLTVPLRMHDAVIGVFNIESNTPQNFDGRDEELAALFGEYIAMAMHMLDLLVVERYTTSSQASNALLSDLEKPMQAIIAINESLCSESPDDERLTQLSHSIDQLRRRIAATAAGPQSILDTEQALSCLHPVPALAGKRVFVADDEINIRRDMGRILEQLGCLVTLCSNGSEIIEQLEQATACGEAPDLVVSDIKMPDYNGYEVFREAHERFPAVPVILMTGFGYDPNHSIVRAGQEGMQSVLFKPFKTVQFVDAVKLACNITSD